MGLRSLDVLQQLPRLSDQRLNLFPLFDRAPRKQAMLERASVLFRRARPRRAAMHPTQLFPAHRRRPARLARWRFGAAARARQHRPGIPAASLATLSAEGMLE